MTASLPQLTVAPPPKLFAYYQRQRLTPALYLTALRFLSLCEALKPSNAADLEPAEVDAFELAISGALDILTDSEASSLKAVLLLGHCPVQRSLFRPALKKIAGYFEELDQVAA